MNNMKEVRIIQSKTEPNKNHLWLSDEGLKQFKGNGWEQVLSNDNGGSGGGSNIKYFDISTLNENQILAVNFVSLFYKFINRDGYAIIATTTDEGTLLAVAIDFNLKLSAGNEILLTVEKMLQNYNVYDSLIACPELTEEQFYDTTLPIE